MDKKKVIIGIVSLIILLIGVAVSVFLIRQQQDLREKASPASSVSITPATKSVMIDEPVDLAVEIDTTTNKVSAAVLEINYDPNKLKLTAFVPGAFLPNVFEEAKIDESAGKATVTLGAQPSNPPQGKGVLATLKFIAKEAGTANITFGASTKATGSTSGQKDTGDILIGRTPSRLTILAKNSDVVASPTPTPTTGTGTTPTPAASPKVSPSASPVGGSPAVSPSPSANAPTVTIPSSGTLKAGDTITGTAKASSTVTIKIESKIINATVKADATGKWSYKIPSTIEAGDHTLTITDSNGTTVKKFKVLASSSTATPSAQDLPVTGVSIPTIVTVFAGIMLLVVGTALAL